MSACLPSLVNRFLFLGKTPPDRAFDCQPWAHTVHRYCTMSFYLPRELCCGICHQKRSSPFSPTQPFFSFLFFSRNKKNSLGFPGFHDHAITQSNTEPRNQKSILQIWYVCACVCVFVCLCVSFFPREAAFSCTRLEKLFVASPPSPTPHTHGWGALCIATNIHT